MLIYIVELVYGLKLFFIIEDIFSLDKQLNTEDKSISNLFDKQNKTISKSEINNILMIQTVVN